MKFLTSFLIALTPLAASSITSVSTLVGTPFVVTYDTFVTTEANMAGRLSITADFGADGSFTCIWADAAPNCSHANFSVSFTNNANTYFPIDNGFWTISNLHSTFVLSAIDFNGVVGPGDGVAFDRCMSGAVVFNDTNAGENCGTNGTIGSDNGWSASTRAGGTSNITAAATYSNILNVSPNAAVGDAYGVLRLVFGGTNSFTLGETFTFNADTDLVENASNIPEPGSILLLGSGLLGLAYLARRQRRP